jgi:murein hydrolase activator
MTARALGLVVLLTLAGVGTQAVAQKTREITKKERELQKLRTEIQSFEHKLSESEKREKSTLGRLDDLEQQSSLIRKLIRELKKEQQKIAGDIRESKDLIDDLNRQLLALKSHYAGYVRSVYKNGRVYDLELLFSSNSINQMYIRIEYLRRFSDQRAEDLKEIVEKKSELEEQSETLHGKLKSEQKLLTEKTSEERSLKRKVGQRQSVLNHIRKNKKMYRQELVRKNQAVKQIETLIADLIEKERIRREEARKKREAEAAKVREGKSVASNALPSGPLLDIEPTGTFAHQRGHLRWPVASGTIASKFGKQVNPELKTVTQNTGIDISVKVGTDVVAVAEGEVSVLSFIPGYGNIMILNHYDGYRTVYAHLSEINVVQSQKVNEGEVIGRSGDSIAGSLLHFEIWKEREKMNPENWLARK